MKKNQKAASYCLIVALCVCAMMLSGCKIRTKKHDLAVATSAVVNSMMVTNMMGSQYGNTVEKEQAQDGRILQTASALAGCPAIKFQTDLTEGLFYQTIEITYAPDCLVNGVAMSGTVSGYWQLIIESLSDVYIESQLKVDELNVEGLTTNGEINQVLEFELGTFLSRISGDMTTTHVDSRSRSIAFEELTVEVSVAEFLAELLGGSATIDMPGLLLNGDARYTDEEGNMYAMEYTEVWQQFNCGMPTSGILHVVDTEQEFDALVDFGDGTCDTIVTITFAGEAPEQVDIQEYLQNRQYRF